MKIDLTNLETLIKNINILKDDKQLVEIRVISKDKNVLKILKSADTTKLANIALSYNGRANVYITLNPVTKDYIHGTNAIKDNQIETRKWLLIDLDPIRNLKGSVSDSMFSKVIDHSNCIKEVLKDRGWFQPVEFSSGNGIHLLYPIKMKNDDYSNQLIKDFLKSLSIYFSTESVYVDQVNYNASRLTRFYGTLNIKGEESNHPYRQSYLINNPVTKNVIQQSLLEDFIKDYPIEQHHQKQTSNDFDLKKWLVINDIQVNKKSRWKGIADRYILNQCPFNKDHTNLSAYIIQFDNGTISAGCLHDSCKGKGWKELKELFNKSQEVLDSSPSSILIRIADDAKYYIDDLEEGYVSVQMEDHRELYKIRSQKFRKWLTFHYYKATGKAPSTENMSQALSVIETKAIFEGESVTLHKRVAQNDDGDKFYYDLGDSRWSVVELTPGEWKVLNDPPVLFNRNKNMKGQTLSKEGGNVHLIDKHFRFGNDDLLFLFKIYVIHCFIPQIPHLISIFHGEKGSSKTTSVRKTKMIVDPSSRGLLTMPKGKEQLALILNKNYTIAFDNLEKLQSHQSELLCIASTGGGLSKRTLYTDDDETILDFKRCVVLNGINIVATKPDLLDRSILLELERIPPKERKEEAVIWKEFNNDLPNIVTGILDTVCKAMEIYPNLQLKELPRMADASKWGYAIAVAMGDSGERFLKVYKDNQRITNRETIADHPVAAAVVLLVEENYTYESSVSELLTNLEKIAMKNKINTHSNLWPKASNVLSKRLKEVKSNLGEIGIEFTFSNTKNSTRIKIESKLSLDDDIQGDF